MIMQDKIIIGVVADCLRGRRQQFPVDMVAMLAAAGWRDGHAALIDQASKLIAAGETLPLDLQRYVVHVAHHGKPKDRGYANLERNVTIEAAVRMLTKMGYSPTRCAGVGGESACSIVVKALRRIGVYMSEAAVAKIWENAPAAERNDG